MEKFNLEVQKFNGKEYYLYPNEKYFSKGRKRLHRVVWEYYKGEIPKGYHVHHIDHNTRNNDISNLALVDGKLHLRFEGKKRFKENPQKMIDVMNHAREFAKDWHKSKEGSEWHSKQAKESYAKRNPIKKICEECSKEYETKHKGNSKYCHNNCKAKANRRLRKEKFGMTDDMRRKLNK